MNQGLKSYSKLNLRAKGASLRIEKFIDLEILSIFDFVAIFNLSQIFR